jgi:flagellar protein FlaF
MYQLCYEEIAEDSAAEERDREHAVFNESIRLLELATSAGVGTPAAQDALYYADQLWTILIEDLGHPGNLLPEATRAALISIGIWVVKEVDLIRRGQSANFQGIASINAIIRDGLN